MNAPFSGPVSHCPHCSAPIMRWPVTSLIESCPTCRRPLVLVRRLYPAMTPELRLMLLSRPKPPRLRSLIHLASGLYGFLMIALVASFALGWLEAVTFVRWLSILLFLVGSILCLDGALAIRSMLDVTMGKVRRGLAACLLAGAKIAAGALALLLVPIGLTL